MGAGTGGGGDVAVCNGTDGGLLDFYPAFTPPAVFPIYVGAGDVNGDGRDDVIASLGQGGGPQVKVFNSTNRAVLHSFLAFDPLFTGGVRVASADFNKDGTDDIVTATGPGGPSQVKVFQGGNLSVIRDFAPEAAGFTGGVFVGAEDFTGDGVPEIVTGAGAGTPAVRLFDGVTSAQLAAFMACEPAFSGGVRVATGDVNADGIPEIITSPGPGRPPEVRCFAYPGLAQVHSFLPYPATFTSGVFISSWSPPQPNLRQSSIRVSPAGKVEIVFEERLGRTLYVDSTENMIDWSLVLSTPATGAPFTFTADIVPGSTVIYRGRSQ